MLLKFGSTNIDTVYETVSKKLKHDLTTVYQVTRKIELDISNVPLRATYWRLMATIYDCRASACFKNKHYDSYLICSLIELSVSNLADLVLCGFQASDIEAIESIQNPTSFLLDRIEDYELALSNLGINDLNTISSDFHHIMFTDLFRVIGLPLDLLNDDFENKDIENMNAFQVGKVLPFPQHFKQKMRFLYSKPLYPEVGQLLKSFQTVLSKYYKEATGNIL